MNSILDISTLTASGQTTIPKAVREFLEAKPGDRIIYVKEAGRVYIRVETKEAP